MTTFQFYITTKHIKTATYIPMFTIYVLAASGERFNETKTCCCLSHRRSRCSRSNPHFYVLCGQRSLIKCSELTIPGRRGEDFPSTNYVYNSTEIYWGRLSRCTHTLERRVVFLVEREDRLNSGGHTQQPRSSLNQESAAVFQCLVVTQTSRFGCSSGK